MAVRLWTLLRSSRLLSRSTPRCNERRMRRSSPTSIGSEKRRRKAPRYSWTSTWVPALGPQRSSLVPVRAQMWVPAWVLASVLGWLGTHVSPQQGSAAVEDDSSDEVSGWRETV